MPEFVRHHLETASTSYDYETSIVSKASTLTDKATEPRSVSPVWQFVCLLAPVVMTGFYLVYALVGLVIDGANKLKWTEEALQVGALNTMIILAINGLVMAYAFFHRLKLSHVLWVSPLVHIVIALLLTLLIWIIAS